MQNFHNKLDLFIMSIGYGWLNPDIEKLESSLVKGRKVLFGVYKGKTKLKDILIR